NAKVSKGNMLVLGILYISPQNGRLVNIALLKPKSFNTGVLLSQNSDRIMAIRVPQTQKTADRTKTYRLLWLKNGIYYSYEGERFTLR
ncbi:MAG: hypothetical protein IKZ19_05105, partial [Clostridia bacterium]|nr:hypothetical protein [Clostridia bacterium]